MDLGPLIVVAVLSGIWFVLDRVVPMPSPAKIVLSVVFAVLIVIILIRWVAPMIGMHA